MTKYSNAQLILEMSVFRFNLGRISDTANWTTGICQNLLQQANAAYTNIHNITLADASKEDSKEETYLLISLLRETWGPFLVRWESVFLTHDRKYRKHVSRKQRDFFQFDFRAIQDVVTELCKNLEELSEKPKKEKKKEEQSKNKGII